MKKLSDKTFTNKGVALLFAAILAIPYTIIASSIVAVPFLSIFLVNILSFYLLIDNLKYLKNKKFRAIYAAINIFKLALLIFNAKTKSLFLTGTDWLSFDHLAKVAVEDSNGIIDIYNNSQDLFVFFVALIYKIFGAYTNQIFFYIYPLSLLLFRYVYKTVNSLNKREEVAIWAALAVIAWPINFVFSISFLREIAIQVMVIVSFYNFVRYLKNKNIKNILATFTFAIGGALMHSGMIALLVVYLYIWLQNKPSKKYEFIKVSTLIVVGMIVFAISFTPIWDGVARHFSDIGSVSDLTNNLEEKHEYLIANTNYIDSAPQSMLELIASIPYRLVMFIFSPFVWQIYSLGTLLAFLVDGILQIGLAMGIFKVFKKIRDIHLKDRNIIVLTTLCIVMIYGVYSLGTNNYGTAMRHRSKALPLAIVLVSAYAFQGTPRKIKTEKLQGA